MGSEMKRKNSTSNHVKNNEIKKLSEFLSLSEIRRISCGLRDRSVPRDNFNENSIYTNAPRNTNKHIRIDNETIERKHFAEVSQSCYDKNLSPTKLPMSPGINNNIAATGTTSFTRDSNTE